MAKNRIVFSDDFILKDQRIGIGTADPKESLDVVGNATISQNLYVGNSIGIGTTSPKSDFDVNGTLSVSGVSTFSNDVNISSSLNGNPIGKFNDGGSVELYNDGSKKFETTGVGVSIFNGTSDTATIEGPGNLIIDPMPVGVGTTSGIVRIKGDLYVDGTETIINSTTIELADFVVGIASTATTDILADGAGIKIGPDNTFLYEYNGGTNPSLKSSENLNVESGKAYQIDQTEVLSATTLGSGVTNSSLTSLGTLIEDLDIESGKVYKINNTEVLSSTTLGSGVTASSLTGLGTLAQSLDLESGNTYKINNIEVLSATTLGSGVTASSLTGLGTLAQSLDLESGNTYKINNTEVLSSTTLGSGVTASSLTGLGTTLTQNLDIESGKVYKINNTEVLSATTLGSGVTASSLTGLGTLTTLSVSGEVSVADKIVHTGDTDTAIRFPSDDTFTIETGGQERLRVTGIASQSVGIGVTNPTALLDIAGSIRIRGEFYDALNKPGQASQILVSTGAGATWADAGFISVGDASTLDGVDSTQFLRSDENDTKTGITTFQDFVDVDANLDIQNTLTVGQGVTVTGISTFNDNVDINANVDIQNTLTVGQGVTVTGVSTFNSNVDVDANLDIRDTLTVGGGLTITGVSTFASNLDIDASVDIQNTLTVGQGVTVTGVSTFNSNVDVDANLDIRDTLTVGQGVTVTGISTFNDNVNINNTLTVGQGVTVTGISTFNDNVNINNTLTVGQGVTVTGVSTFNDNVNINNTLTVGQGVTVTGISTFNNNVDVKDTLIVGSGLTVTGISTFNNNVDVKDTLIVGQGVTITGVSTFNNNVDVKDTLIVGQGVTITGVSTFNNNVDVKDTLIVGQGVTVTGISTFNNNVLFADGTESSPSISFKLDQNTGIFRASDDGIAFATNGTERARIISDGKVGIGTTIPTQTLDVNGTATVHDSLSIGTTTPTAKLTIDVGTGTTAIDVQGSAGQLFSVTNNLTSGSIFSVNDVSGIPSIDVDADGTIQLAPFGSTENVGVGITNPSQKLDVNGGIRLRGALYDFGGNPGGVNQSLVSTGTGVTWSTPTGVGAGQQIYEEEASTAYYLVGTKITPSLTGIGTAGFASDTVVLKDSKIGIGSDSPAESLDISGTNNQYIQITSTNSQRTGLLFSNSSPDVGKIYYNHGDDSLRIETNSLERIRVKSDGVVSIGGSVGIGTDNPQSKLDVIGDIKISGVSTLGTVQISSGIITATSGVVTYYGDGSNLTGVSAESVDSYQFNTGITSSFSAVLTGIGGSIITFPSTAGKQYIVYSIHAANVAAGNTEVNVTGSFDFNGGERSYFAYSVPIPTGTGIDLLIQPQILNPSDQIAMRGLDYDRNGADSVVEVHVSYQEKTSTEYFGVGFGTVGIGFTDPIGIYTSSTYPSVIQSIRLTNRTDTGAYPISLSIANGVSTIRIVDNLIIPKYGSVEIIDSSPKRLNLNDILNVQVDQTSTIDVQVSGKQIV